MYILLNPSIHNLSGYLAAQNKYGQREKKKKKIDLTSKEEEVRRESSDRRLMRSSGALVQVRIWDL